MEKYVINGGNALHGEVEISGAKNAAVAIIPATVLAQDICVIENVPNISDVSILFQILRDLGANVRYLAKNTVEIDTRNIREPVVPYESARHLRASYYFLGAFLGRFGEAHVSPPGGCNFGVRPIDQHIKGFEALGATVTTDYGFINAQSDEMFGAHIYLDVVSVGATVNIMLAAVRAKGLTILENAAKEPHIVDVANMLNSMGADIRGAGTDKIRINGVEKLHGTVYSTIPDQIEAGTFMCAAAATGGEILIKNVIPKHLECISSKLMEMGCTIIEYDDSVKVKAGDFIRCANIKTLPYPGFPTDMQPQMAAVLTMANGVSTVTESIFENRFKYVAELNRMGAITKVEGRTAIITGVGSIQGAKVKATDLRAGAALVIAGLAAEGFTTVDDIVYIKRGYERFDEKLSGLGATIAKVDSEREEQKFKLKVG